VAKPESPAPASAAESPAPAPKAESPALKYGLYIHYGIATFAHPGERGQIPAQRFDPGALDMRAWARTAKEAGMTFAVLTAKHESGFCLWDSADYDFDIARSPYRRDLLADFIAACDAEGIVPGVHYSIPDAYNEGAAHDRGPVPPPYFGLIKRHITELASKYPGLRILVLDVAERLSADQLESVRAILKDNNPGCALWNTTGGDKGPHHASATVITSWMWSATAPLNSAQQLLGSYNEAQAAGQALILNVGPAPSGQIPDDQAAVLRELKALIAHNPAGVESRDLGGRSEDTLTPQQVEQSAVNLQGSIGGVGLALLKRAGELRIGQVMPDTPASRAGLQSGALIATINGIPTETMSLDDAVKLFRGAVGTPVIIELRDADTGSARKVELVRETIVFSGVNARELDADTGLLAISQINQQTPAKVREALDQFIRRNKRGLVLDLRDNSGGSYDDARKVAGYFVGSGPSLWLVRRAGQSKAEPVQAMAEKVWSQSMVVLINKGTAGSGELIASAIQSVRHATLLGQTTAGSAQLKKLQSQPDGGAKKVVVGNFYTAADEPIQGTGIKPDITLDPGLANEEVLRRGKESLGAVK
jgi:C-terminal peptidase prc